MDGFIEGLDGRAPTLDDTEGSGPLLFGRGEEAAKEEFFEDARRRFTSKVRYRNAVNCFKRARHFTKQGRELLAQPQLLRCQRLLESALYEAPENRAAHFLLAAVLMLLGKFKEAKSEATSLLKRLQTATNWQEMKDPVVHQAVAHCSWRLGQDEDAMTCLWEART